MQKKLINKMYQDYISVIENSFDKWSKEFFFNFFLNKNVFFFFKNSLTGLFDSKKNF